MEQQAGAKMRQMDASVLQQRDRLVQAQARNEQLSALVARTGGPNNPGGLERLREEVAALRRQTNEMTALQDEEHRLQASLAKIREDLLGPNVDDFEPSEVLAAKEDYCIELSNALRDYAFKHHDRFPTNFDDVTPFLSAKARNETNFSTAQFEIVFQGSMANAFNNKYAHPGHIILFRERKPWKNTDGKWVKFYEMIPGQKWFVTLPDGNFDAWEKQHLVPPEPADE
jgi:hypothetical protein